MEPYLSSVCLRFLKNIHFRSKKIVVMPKGSSWLQEICSTNQNRTCNSSLNLQSCPLTSFSFKVSSKGSGCEIKRSSSSSSSSSVTWLKQPGPEQSSRWRKLFPKARPTRWWIAIDCRELQQLSTSRILFIQAAPLLLVWIFTGAWDRRLLLLPPVIDFTFATSGIAAATAAAIPSNQQTHPQTPRRDY